MTDNPRVEARRVRDAGWLTSLPLLLNAVSLGANGYIIRRLGPEGYGTLVVAMGLAGATTILSNLGMRALYTKAVAGADDPTTARLLREQLALRSALGAAAGLLAITAAAVFYPGDQAVLLCTILQAIVVVLTIGWTVLADVLNARERFAENAIIALKAGLVLTGLATVVAAFGGGPVEVGATYLAGPLVNFALQARSVRQLGIPIGFGGAGWPRYRELLVEARVLAANDVVSALQTRAEGVWAPLLFGKATIGVYNAGMLPTTRLGQAPDGVATAFFPAMAAAHNRGDSLAVRQHATQMFTLLLVVTLPLAVFLWFGAPYIGSLMFPDPGDRADATLATFIARISSLAIPLSGIGLAMRYSVQAAGLHSQNAKDQMASTTIGALVGLGAALSFGVRGLATAVVVRACIAQFVQGRTFRREYPGLILALPWPRLLACLLPPLLVLVSGIGTEGTSSYWGAAGFALIAAVSYMISVLGAGLIALPNWWNRRVHSG